MESSNETDVVALREKYLSGIVLPVHQDPIQDKFEEECVNRILVDRETLGKSRFLRKLFQGMFPLEQHACSAKLVTVLLHLGVNVNQLGWHRVPALFKNVSSGSSCTRALKILLDAGAYVHFQDPQGLNIFHYALVSTHSRKKIQLLLQYGARPSKQWLVYRFLGPTKSLQDDVKRTLALLTLSYLTCFPWKDKHKLGITKDVLMCLKEFL
jgi:hypothetical protein